MSKRNDELELSLMSTDSANHDSIPGDPHHADTVAPIPVVEQARGNPFIHPFLLRDHNHQYNPDFHFPYPEGYIGVPNHFVRPDNLTMPGDVISAAFNLNNLGKFDNRVKFVTPTYGSSSRPLMANPSGMAMSCNLVQPPLDMNLGMAPFHPNQGGAEPLAMGKLDERFINIGSGSNNASESGALIPKINVYGNSERLFIPPINTYHNRLGSRSSSNPSLDLNGAFSGFQNVSEIVPAFAFSGNHEAPFDSGPGLHLGPSRASRRPAASNQNYYLGQFNRDSSMGMVTDRFPTELLHKTNDMLSSQSFANRPLAVATRSTRGMDRSSDHGQSQVVGSIQQLSPALRPHSTFDRGIQTGMGNITAQDSRPSAITSLKRAASEPLSSSVPNYRRRTQPTQFLHASAPTWTGLAPSVSNTPRTISPSVHAAQSFAPEAAHSCVPSLVSKTPCVPSLVSNTPRAISPSISNTPCVPSLVSNTPRAISPSIEAAQSYAPEAAHSCVPSLIPAPFPAQWTKPALPAPNTTPAIPHFLHRAPYIPPNDKRISSFHPPSHTPPHSNEQLIAQSLPRPHLRAPFIPSYLSSPSDHIKFKDQTPEPIGYKCFLCKRDLSYAPEGPISHPAIPPATAVLSCGHTFHDYCLERITPDDQSENPPCIPCALGE